MRYMGLDIGEKTVGVAVSDPLGFTAQPIETIRYKSPSEATKRLCVLVREREVEEIVAGLPLNMSGDEGPQAQKVRNFMSHLGKALEKKGLAIAIEFWDERLSTVAVERTLLEADVSRAKRKKVIDKMAAVYILQGFLDMRRQVEE